MKTQVIALCLALANTSFACAADSLSNTDTVIAHPAVVAVVSLLNSANANACPAPKPQDVQIACFGAHPPNISQPTIAGLSCGFFLTVTCANGASATISGENHLFEIVDQNRHVSNQTSAETVIQDVTLKPATK